MAFFRLWLMVIFLVFPGAAGAATKDDATNDAALLDRPDTVQRVPPKSPTDPTGEVRCNYYKDLMIRETGTNTPAPGDATLIVIAAKSGNPPCGIARSDSDLRMKTAAYTFIGRKGMLLFFRETNSHGAVSFLIVNAVDGVVVYNDSKFGDGFRVILGTKSGLHLRYTRGVNGSCSIYKEGPACWAKMMNEGKIPRVMAQSQPSVQTCGNAYRRFNTSSDIPSIVSYDVDVTMERSGKLHVNSRGPTNCAPVP